MIMKERSILSPRNNKLYIILLAIVLVGIAIALMSKPAAQVPSPPSAGTAVSSPATETRQ
jgi:hypothetical protein